MAHEPISIIVIGPGWSEIFSSLSEAAATLHISRGRLKKALESPLGVIDGVYPVLCVDEALEQGDSIEEEEIAD